jgi:DNA-binding transcriptional regulator/RsmH inhibitor MraZ
MTFRGLNEHSLDSKDRITVPAQYRASFAEGIVLMQGIEPCV